MLSEGSGGLAYWKQILPDRTITYRGQQLLINRRVHQAAIRAFRAKALPQTAFLLANADNAHTMDPERFRGKVTDMRLARPGETPGLYAKIEFANAKAAEAVIGNPDLGVSCRLEQYLERNGKTYEAAVVHVLGTLDPVVPDMSPWEPVDLSAYDSARKVIDLSRRSYDKEKKVAKRTTKKSGADSDTIDLSEALDTLDEMSDEELDALIGDLETEIEADTETDDDDEDDGEDDLVDEEDDESDDDEDDDLVDDGSDEPVDDKPVTANLSRKQRRQIDLANSQANEANARALRALRQLSDTNWENTRDRLVRSGLPPAVVDLAEPFLHTVERQTIDLSNGSGKKIDVAKRVERILDSMAGFIKLGGGKGHGVDLSNTDEGKLSTQDQAMLTAWDAAYPT